MKDNDRLLRRYIFSNMVSMEQFESDLETAEERNWFTQNEERSQEGKYLWLEYIKNGQRQGFPYFTDKETEHRYNRYVRLMQERSELFAENEAYPIVTDLYEMLSYEQETGTALGVVFESGFYMLAVDLIRGEQGCYPYSRVIYPASGGTVILPRRRDGDGQWRLGLITGFRHPTRAFSGGELPRGFMDAESEKLNVKKEAMEELGITEEQITDVQYLGQTVPDSGLSNNKVGLYLVDIEGQCAPQIGHEGIVGVGWLTEGELKEKLRTGAITDGFTQSAVLLYLLKTK